MASRGPYAKGVAKRAEILDTALTVIAQNGYSGATVKQLADAVGLSQNGLLHYFESKDNLFVEILRHHEESVAVQIDAEHADFAVGFRERILNALIGSLEAAGISQLMLSVSAAGSEVEHVAHDFIANRYVEFRRVAATAIRELQSRGEFPAHGDPDAAAAIIAAAFDGLQSQWLYDHSFDVCQRMSYLLSSLGLDESESQPAALGPFEAAESKI
ncbi:TetR/AcrR family transcriptional regulator [Microbacterium sp. NPDC090225]|uniref:TetR/AcrR family transcriptional regulator n=1 Tax=Microbacterium sp. NPDC090225 TaxID=3364207 RepID=UPI003818B666